MDKIQEAESRLE